MQRVNGELSCIEGDMGYSQRMEKTLLERLENPIENQSIKTPAYMDGVSKLGWYCPGCGKTLGDSLWCDECRITLTDLVFTLVELHPHR